MLIETSGYILSDDEKRFFENLSIEPQTPAQIAERAGLGEHETRKLLGSLLEKGAAREVGHMEGHYVESTEPQVKTWAEQQPDAFRAVAWEAGIMRIILSLVIVFVTVLIFCLLWIMVDVKVPDIGILVALGARTTGVVGIFIFDGLIVGLVGATVGLGLGVGIAWKIDWAAALLSWLGLNVFPEKMFYGTADKLPCKVELVDVVIVVAVAIVCSVVASIPPALKAAVQDPIESLRHE
jgi:lipoprotein-releasing system permease protein